VEKSELAQSLHELFSALHKIKARPLNTHFTAMPTTVTINVGSIPITLAVPPPMLRNAEGPVSLEVSDGSSDDESDDEWAGVTGPDGLLLPKQPHLRIEPWQTLLMLHEEEDVLAAMATGRETARRNSRSQQEEDELLAGLIRACDISKPLHEIAHTLRYDLEGIVIPLVRELVQSKRAVLVDVVNIRLRSILVPTSIDNHLRTLTQHAVRWSVLFPYLPPLVPFLALISATPMPFRDLLPADAQAEPSRRDVYIRAITWLLRSDLVQQARVRARVVASPAVKDAAWRRLWHRRRNKWLRERTASMTSRASTGSRGSRPSFGANSMSQRAPSSSAAASVVLSPKAEMAALPRRSASGSVSAGTGASAAGGSEGGTSAALNPLETVLASRVPRLANAPPTSLDVTRTATTDSYLDYDSDLEMDSDVEGDGDGPAEDTRILFGEFSVNQQEPAAGTVPTFTGSFIFHPAQAQKDEARWLRIIREHNSDPVLRSRFDL
jgi:hypothetical protein